MKKRNYCNNKDLTEAIIIYQKLCKKVEKQGLIAPQMPKYIGECILNICNRLTAGKNFNFSSYCVDEQTEALTQRGWLNYLQITTDDIILSIDPITRRLIWSPIYNLYVGQYNGLMFKLDGSTIDALVTPGHKFLTVEHGLTEIDDLLVKDHLITMGDPVQNDVEIYSDAFVEMVGWYVTEGTKKTYNKKNGRPTHTLFIYQSEKINPNKCDRIQRSLETLMNAPVKRYKGSYGGVYFKIPHIYSLDILRVAPNKILSYDFIIQLSQRQKCLLIKTMIDGDGTLGGRNRDIPQYFQKEKSHIDSFLFLCTLAGYTTSTNYREWITFPSGKEHLSKGYLVTLTNRKECYLERVDFHGGKRNSGGNWQFKKHQPTHEYNGIVWCPQTEYGTFICRRNKKIYGLGNSYRDEMILDAVERCIYAIRKFNAKKSSCGAFSYLTTVAINAQKKRINDEKKQNYTKHKYFQAQFMQHELEGLAPDEKSDKVVSDFEERQAAKKEMLARKKN